MNEALARRLTEDYVNGWVASDVSKIVGTLCNDCFITESHGPTYRGVDEVRRWADEWYQTGSVDAWSIDAFFLDTGRSAAFFEWSFTCTIQGHTTSLDGASVIQFKADKIYHLHEYRMTELAFDYFKKHNSG